MKNTLRILCIIMLTLGFAWSTSCGGGTAATLESIAVTPTTPSIAAGATQQFTATATYSDGTTEDITLTVTWATSDTAVADFETPDTDNGLATGIAAGTATISATDDATGIFGSTDMAVAALSGMIKTLYSNNINWGTYLANDGADIFTATDTACDAATAGPDYRACLNGGFFRSVEVTGRGVCDGLTATDSLGLFTWVCDSNTNDVRMVSTGFADGMGLSDLVDFATASWKQLNVTVFRGSNPYLATDVATLFTNTIRVSNAGGDVNAGEVVIVTADADAKFVLRDDGSTLLIEPGHIINYSGGPDDVVEAVGRNFLWVEGAIDATGNTNAIRLNNVKFSSVRNAFLKNADTNGARLEAASNNNYLDGISVMGENNTSNGVQISLSTGNFINNVFATDVTSEGIYLLNNSTGNCLTNITTANTSNTGIYVDSSDNIFINITTFNSNWGGVYLSVGDNILINSTATNNDQYGFYIEDDSNLTTNATAVNNGSHGFHINGPNTDQTLQNAVSANNGDVGFRLDNSSDNYFTGPLKVGSNTTGNCQVTGGTNPGIDSSCNPNGSSDFTKTVGADLSNSFIAKANSDSVNADGATGTKLYDDITDWVSFENAFRGWGVNESDFPNPDNRGLCSGGNVCRIWDWSMTSADTVIRDVLPMPTGNDTITHTWSDASTTTFLRNAVEIMYDWIGNDNGLCESNETCLYTPNIGSYQGHGNLISAGAFTDGTISGVTLMKYETNGR